MSNDLAMLGLGVDSRPVASAAQDLDRITDAAKRAEKQADSFGAKTEAAGRRAAAANDNAARAARRVVASLEFERAQLGRNAAQQAIHNNLRLAGAAAASAEGRAVIAATVALEAERAAMLANEAVLARRVALINKVKLAAAGLAAGVVAFGASGVPGARDLSASLAEISTLIEGTDAEMQRIQAAARDMGREFGTTAASQVKAFYQAISAGATDLGQATLLLESANKVAIGGITDTVTAVDVLTTATNAYAASGLTASNASDALFVGMRAGKTTISELASSLGQVIPIAASLGVNFDELVAGVAALTTQGQSTAQAVTGVRAILSQVAKPADEATKLAKKLGLEFNTTSLQAKGLSGFLDDVIAKTGGNVDAMAKLFGSVEALNAVLSFAGGGGAAFTKILGDMANKAGAADAAYQKVAQNQDKRLGVALNRIADVAVRLGEVLLTVILPAAETFATVLELIADNAADLAIILAPIAAVHLVKLIAGFASLAAGMNVAAVAARALSVAMAFVGGPIGLALTGLAAAFVLLRDSVSAVDKATKASESAYQGNIALLNDAKSSSERYTAALRNQIAMQLEVAKANAAAAGEAKITAAVRSKAFQDATGLSFAPFEYDFKVKNESFKAAARVANQLADQLAEVDANMKKVQTTANSSGTLSGLGGSDVRDPYAELIRSAQQFIAAQKLEADALFMTEQAVNHLRYEQDLLNKAANDNIDLTVMSADGERTRGQVLRDLAANMAAAEQATRSAKMVQDAYNQTASAGGGVLRGLLDGTRDWKQALLDIIPIVLRLGNSMNIAGGGQGLFGGGIFQSFIGGLLGVGFDSGGFTGPGPASKPAGIVHAGEYVFSKRATDRIGLGNLEAIHRSAKGYSSGGFVSPATPSKRYAPVAQALAPAANSNGGGQTVNVEQHFHISGAVSSEEIKAAIREQAARTKADIEGSFAKTFEKNRKAGTV